MPRRDIPARKVIADVSQTNTQARELLLAAVYPDYPGSYRPDRLSLLTEFPTAFTRAVALR